MRRCRLLLLLPLLGCATPPARAPETNLPAEADFPAETRTIRVVVPLADPACEDVRLPPIRSVVVVPPDSLSRALAPVVRAACSCSRAGETVRLSALIVPEAGLVTAHAVDDEGADACLQQALDGRFVPFGLESDCIDCGPRRLPVFHGSTPPPPPRSRIVYPFTLVHRYYP